MLAVWSEYCAGVVVAALLGATVLAGLLEREFLSALWRGSGTAACRPALLFLATGIAAVPAYAKWTDWTDAGSMNHLAAFFPAPGESWARFGVRGVAADLSYFAPFELAKDGWLAVGGGRGWCGDRVVTVTRCLVGNARRGTH